MRPLSILPFLLMLASCNPPESKSAKPAVPAAEKATAPAVVEWNVKSSVVRLNSTQQTWNPWQPWEKNPPVRRRALAAIIGPQLVVTTSELVADATYLEFESADGSRFTPAKVIAVDYEANLALLGPASETQGAELFANSLPFKVAAPAKIGDTLEVLQLEDNGLPLVTPGTLQSVDVSPNLLPGQSFLTYLLKASMRSASSSYTLPVLRGRELAGVLLSYNSKDQVCDVVSTDILARFITEATQGTYGGFPGLGISTARTEDGSLRQWLKLADDQGGIYIRNVRKGGAADRAGVREGDVLLAVDGQVIDRRGYYQHPNYGSLSWGHLIRGGKSSGDATRLSLLREGQPLEIEAKVEREDEKTRLVPSHAFDKAPNYLVKGGLVFQELSRPLLESFGEEWRSRAPLNLLDAFTNPENYEESMDRVVFLSGVIPTPATVGYEGLRNLIVRKANGREIRDMKTLIEAFDSNMADLHSIEFADENLTVHLDDLIATEVDTQLLKRGINHLSRAE
ncbi:MAG: PDZ domain-containing protein [Luteolibacter sp.]|jgi:S1-C subfamily serine protease|nr:PDZ domain-containing protein [Luteolibacter sp.]